MRDIKLDGNGDLFITANNDMAIVSGRAASVQLIGVRLSLFLGEIYTDTRLGFPWIQDVLQQKVPNLGAVSKLIADCVLQVPGVVACKNITLTPNTSTRLLTGSFTAVFDDGGVETIPLPSLDELLPGGTLT